MEYTYTVITQDGKSKKGKIEASSRESAFQLLKDQGHFPMEVTEASLLQKDITFTVASVKVKDLSMFCRQFSSILKAGVVVLDALYLLKDQTENKLLKQVIGTVYSEVEKGEPLHFAMGQHKKVFPDILVNMIQAGEESGNLEVAFTRMAIHFEKEYRIQQAVQKAVTYPAIVMSIAMVVVIILVTFVVPTFTQMFTDMGMDLPITTRVLIATGEFLKNRWYIAIAVVVGVIWAFMAYSRTAIGKLTLSGIKLKMPIIGNLNQKIVASRFTRTLSTLLAAGIPVLDALQIVARVVDNTLVEKGLMEATVQVGEGVPLSKPLEEMKIFPLMVTHMVKVGETTGEMESILTNVADFYDSEVETTVAQVTTLLEPLIIVLLAIVVGGVVLSIVQPMFQMYGALGSI
ncbi:MAG: type II secretion system F family protein [Niameybacter sp.]